MTLNSRQYQGLAAFRYALRHFAAASERLSRDSGVTQQQYQALLSIKTRAKSAMSMGELAERLLLTHHAAVQLIDRLAKAGLAERSPSPEDRRSVHVTLTRKGEALLDDLAAKHLREVLQQEPLLRRSLQLLRKLGPPD